MYAPPGSASMRVVAALAFIRGVPGAKPRRDACRTTSWFDRTHVEGAPTESAACSDDVMTARRSSATHEDVRKSKLNAWCISSERTYLTARSCGSTHASAQRMRSGVPYDSRIWRQ